MALMKPVLQARLTQHLALTPQLQQAIKLLQLSSQELRQEINQAVELNPLLEIAEEQGEENENATEELLDNTNDKPQALDLDQQTLQSELQLDVRWDDTYPDYAANTKSAPDISFAENISNRTHNLREHLHWQLNMARFSKEDELIATVLIDSIDDDGLLSCTLEEAQACLLPDLAAEPEEIIAVLHQIQNFDPPGVAARNVQESLLIQLRQFPDNTPGMQDAKSIIKNHLELLSHHDYRHLMKAANINEPALNIALALIQSLQPKPGSLINSQTVDYVVPDVIVRKKQNAWEVAINSEALPKVRVHTNYNQFDATDSKAHAFIQGCLQEARWFIKSISSRNETLLKVAEAIVAEQHAFFEHGVTHMRPLTLQTIADDLGMHESTISRVTTQKFLLCPQGIFEFKYFFSSQLTSKNGENHSSTAIRALLKNIIAKENQQKPLSDNQLVNLLAKQGIQVARRTLAKYREELMIPPSHERKQIS